MMYWIAFTQTFPVVMYRWESWTIKNAERQRTDGFELWCWRRLLRVPSTASRSNQSILKEISPGCSLEGLMLKVKLQYFDHLMWRADSLEKTLMLGKIEGRRRRGRQRMRWLDGITNTMYIGFRWTLGVGDGQGGRVCCCSWGQRVGHDWATELNWTDTNATFFTFQFTYLGKTLPESTPTNNLAINMSSSAECLVISFKA